MSYNVPNKNIQQGVYKTLLRLRDDAYYSDMREIKWRFMDRRPMNKD